MTLRAKNLVHTELATIGAVNANADTTGVDVSALEGDCIVTLQSNAGTGTTPTLDAKLQHSDDDVTYTDVPNGAFTQVTDGGAAFETLQFNAGGFKQYLRLNQVVSGTTPSFTRSLTLVGQNKYST